jgi:multidrug resistance efflux pump
MKRTHRRPFLIFWILGVVALVASTAGAISALHSRHDQEVKAQPGSVTTAKPAASLTAYGTIDIDSGITPLFPTVAGRVVEVLVHENDKVKAGAPLVRLDDRLAKQRLKEAEAALAVADKQLAQAKKLPLEHERKIALQKHAIEAMKTRLAVARLAKTRKEELVKNKQANQVEADIAAKEVEGLETAVLAEEDKLKLLELEDPQLTIGSAEDAVAAKKALVAQAQLAVDECVLKAPTAGEILQVGVGPGSVIGTQTTQPAIQFCPDLRRIVRAEIEQEFASRIHPGQTAIIQDESGDKESWRGKVLRLSNWYTQRRNNQAEGIRIGSNDVRTLECIIVLDPGNIPFRLGQRVRAILGSE